MSIPKIIHLIWIGDTTKRPDQWLQTWADLNPTYRVRIWGNEEVAAASWALPDRLNAWYRRELVGAVDIIRWEILLRHGGIALDADSECIRPLEDWLLETDCFAAWENEVSRPGLIATGALGCVAGHDLFRQVLRDIRDDPSPFDGAAWQKVGPLRLTTTVRNASVLPLTIYPSHFFFPRHFTGVEYHGSGPVFARQFWGSTHEGWKKRDEMAAVKSLPTQHP